MHTTEGMRRSGCRAPLIHSLGTKWGEWLIWRCISRRKVSGTQWTEAGRPQRGSRSFEENKRSLVPSGHWQYFSVTVTEIFLRFIPESVRWLLARQKNRRAGKIVKKAARVNGVILSDRLLSGFESAKAEHIEVSLCVEYCWNWDVQCGQWDGKEMGCKMCPTLVKSPHLDYRMCSKRTVATLWRLNYKCTKML